MSFLLVGVVFSSFFFFRYVTMHHMAFLPSTISQQSERWIAHADELETAFVDKKGSLEIVFVGGEVCFCWVL